MFEEQEALDEDLAGSAVQFGLAASEDALLQQRNGLRAKTAPSVDKKAEFCFSSRTAFPTFELTNFFRPGF